MHYKNSNFFFSLYFIEQKTYFHCECSCCWGQIKTGNISQRGWLYSSEEVAAEILRQLEEDVDSDIEVERNENEISVSGEVNTVEVMDGIIPESSINIITQRDEESSDKSEHDYGVNENSDEEATISTMY